MSSLPLEQSGSSTIVSLLLLPRDACFKSVFNKTKF